MKKKASVPQSPRFTRVAKKVSAIAITLLQREHRTMTRKVKMMPTIVEQITLMRRDELISRADLLSWLHERGR